MPLILLSLLTLFQTAPPAAAFKVANAQPRVYVERSAAGQLVNCDFVVENLTDEALTIVEIEVSVYDRAGALVVRKFVNDNGASPSVWTIPNREVAAKSSALILNPLYFFDHTAELHRLDFKFTLAAKDRKRHGAGVSVSPVVYEPKTALVLPLAGRLLVWDGHDFLSHHRRWDYLHPVLQRFGFKTNAGRYSYDFVHVDERGEMRRGPAEKNESWFSFGQPVRAAGAGRVADVYDRAPDNRDFDQAEITTRELAPAGNYVVIDHGNGEFSIFMHLKQASAKVKVGDAVKQGQLIAAVGASGSSLFPHLHYELRDGAGYKTVEGLPSYFNHFRRRLGAKSADVRRGQIDSGDIVEAK